MESISTHASISGLLSPGKTYELFIDAETDIGEVTQLTFLWNNHINPMLPKFGANKIELLRGKDGKS
ncbi:hypothetical protein J4Q44_G00007370 [Coregonus suidteri]|uniref:Uncharacterized protein n=1 Tax=Coregonus suidteri TaxID=861788 RepID=A0AAN8RAE1_9TELE